jgi:hypothetical protein
MFADELLSFQLHTAGSVPSQSEWAPSDAAGQIDN